MENQIVVPITLRDRMSAGIQSINNRVKQLKNGINSLGSGTRSLSTSVSTANTFLSSLNATASRSPGLFSRIAGGASKLLGVFSGFSVLSTVFNSISSSVGTAVDRIDTMDLFDKKMTLITGDAGLASEALDQLNSATKGTAYYLNTAAKAVQNFVVRGMDTQAAINSVDIWMDAVTAYGNGTNEQFESVTDAISKMRTKGTVEMRYLNRLFAAGINPVQMYATATGQAASDVQTALSEKKISSEEFLSVVETAMREGTNGVQVVAGAAKSMATTWKATLGNMRMAIARGTIEMIEGVSSVFEALGTENGLKGMFKSYGSAMETFLSGTGKALQNVSTFFSMAIQKVTSEHKESTDRAAKTIEDNNNKIKKSQESAYESLMRGFANSLGPQMEQIVLKFQQLKVTWSEVRLAWAQGIEQVSGAFGEFLGNYLGLTIDGFANLSKTVAEFLKLGIPKFFDFLQEKLTWLNDNKDTVVSGIKAIIVALLGFKTLEGVAGTITGIDSSLKGLNATLGVLSGGRLQIPTLEAFANRKIERAEDNGNWKAAEAAVEGAEGINETTKKPGMFKRLREYTKGSFSKLKTSTVGLGQGLLGAIKNNPITEAYTYQRMRKNGFSENTYNHYKSNMLDKKAEAYKQRYKDMGGGFFQTAGNIAKGGLDEVKNGLSSLYKNSLFRNIGNGFKTISAGLATMGQSFTNTFPALSGFLSTLASISPALGVVALGIGAVAGAFGGLAVALGTLNSDGALSSGITNFFNNVITAIPQFGNKVVGVIDSVKNKLIGLFSDTNVIQNGVNVIVSFVTGVLTAIPQVISTGIQIVFAFGAAVLQTLPTIVSAGFQALKSFIQGIVDHGPEILAAWGQMLQNILQTIVQYLPDMISGGIKLVVALAKGIWDFAWFLGSKLWDAIRAAFSYVWNNFPEILNNVLEWFGKIGGAIKDGIVQGIHSVGGDWLLQFFGVDTEALVAADETKKAAEELARQQEQVQTSGESAFDWNAAWTQAIGQASEQAQTDINNMTVSMDTLGDSGQLAGEEIAAGVENGVDGATEYMDMAGAEAGSAYGNAVAGNVAGASEQAKAQALQLGNDILGAFNGALFEGDASHGMGISFLQNFILGLQEAQQAVYTEMSRIATNALTVLEANFLVLKQNMPTSIADGITAMVSSVMGSVTSMCEQIAGHLAGTVNSSTESIVNLKDTVIASFDEMKDTSVFTVQNMKSQVLAQVTSFVTQAKTELSPFDTMGDDAAKSMMDGFRDGIVNRTQQVVDATDSLVKKVKEAFTKGLGIASPSKETYAYGGFTGEGFINGLNDSQLITFVQGIVSDMKAAFTGGHFDPNVLVHYLADNETVELIGYINKINGMEGVASTIAYPLQGGPYDITSWFGPRPASDTGGVGSTNHGGIDIGAPPGTPILSILPGQVTQAGYMDGYGNAVTVNHGGGLESLYGHMTQVMAAQGQSVSQGQTIGTVGSTGNSTGPHLHLSMFQDNNAIDPYPYLQGAGVVTGDPLATAIQNALNAKNGIVTDNRKLGNVPYDISAGAAQWSDVVLQALAMLGQPASLLQGVLYAIDSESSGNPNAINDWDTNAMRGDPSRGLLQTIGSTFNAYRNPSLSDNIYDPLANVYAALNYMMHIGGIEKVIGERLGGWTGYAVGTRSVPQDMLAMIHKDEAIIPAAQNPYSSSGGDYLKDIALQIMDSDSGLKFSNGGAVSQSTNNQNNNNTFHVTFNQTISNSEEFRTSKEEVIDTFHQIMVDIMNGNANGLYS